MGFDMVNKAESQTDKSNAHREERAVWICLLVDLATFLPCVAVAVLSGSMLLLSDMLEYAKSFVSQGVALRILRAIRKGDVRDYDYGPGKMERVGSLFGAICYILGLSVLGGFSVYRLLRPVELNEGFTVAGIAVQAASVAINAWLWWRTRRLAVQTRSPLIDMQWRHSRSDTVSSAAMMMALILTLVFRSQSWDVYIDPLCALVYVFYAIGSYVPVIRESFFDLLDRTLDEDLQLKIMKRLAEHYDGYDTFHDVRSRRSGNRIFIEIGLSFDPACCVGEVIDTIESLRTALEGDIPRSEVRIVLRKPDRRM